MRCKWCNDILSPEEIEAGVEDECPWKEKLNEGDVAKWIKNDKDGIVDKKLDDKINNSFHFKIVDKSQCSPQCWCQKDGQN